jgi:hypothetical protein
MQRYTVFFIAVNAVHVSGGFSDHHQELKTVRTASGIWVRVQCRQIQVPTPIPRVGASRRKESPMFNSAGAYSGGRRRRVGADSRSQTVYRNDFLILVPTLGIGT